MERSLSVCSCRDSILVVFVLFMLHVETKRARDSICESKLWLHCAAPKRVLPEKIRHWKNRATNRAMDSPRVLSETSLRHPIIGVVDYYVGMTQQTYLASNHDVASESATTVRDRSSCRK